MRHNLRRGGNDTGFFAFQDIITAVIGIILFIALLLSLFIGFEPSLPEEKPLQPASPAELARLEEVLNQLAALEEELQIAKSASVAGSQSDIDALNEELARLESQISAMQPVLPSADASPEVQAQLQSMEAINRAAEAERENAERMAAEARKTVASLEDRLREVQQARLDEEARRNDLFLIPERSQTTKLPVLLDVRENAITLQTLDGSSQQARTSARGDIADLLRDYPKGDFFVVLYFRPSTFHLSERILDSVRSMGYEIGYDILGDANSIRLGRGDNK
jgi:hypothetical protein